MFYASWTQPYNGPIETLRFHQDPRRHGLGQYTDVDGVRWDVYAIRGKRINARRVGHHPNYYSTATASSQFSSTAQGPDLIHTWKPYAVEVVEATTTDCAAAP